MRDDAELLREYAEDRSEDAFSELVRRHLGLVYNAALRQVGGDAHLAQDVARSVFTDLARKARELSGRPVLAGWLYTSTRYAAVQVVRGEQRRRAREQEAQRMNEVFSGSERVAGAGGGATAESVDWERLRPVIDDALHALGERDREAVLLRFFEGRAFAEVGAKLAVSEDAARVRVSRALEKLRGRLRRRGVTSTAGALAVALSGQAMATVPAGLAVTVAGTALAGVSTAAGAAGWMTFMGITKLQIGLAGVILAGGTAGFIAQEKVDTALRDERARVRAEGGLRAKTRDDDDRRRARLAAELSELRKDDVAFARLEVEADVLRQDLAANLAARERLQKAVAPEGGDAKKVFNVSEIDEVPKMKSWGTPPKYPADLRAIGVEGNAVVRFVVDADGTVRSAEAVKTTHDAFAEVAVSAVKVWTFEAGKKADVPVNVQMVVPIVFALQEEDGRANTWF